MEINAGTGGTGYSYAPTNGDVIVVTMTSDAKCANPSVADAYIVMNVETPGNADSCYYCLIRVLV